MKWEENKFSIVKPNITKDEKIQEVSLEDFKLLLTTDKPVLIDFHTVWCSPCRKMSPIIDLIEVEYKEFNGHLWHMNYPLTNEPNTAICVATTRPETMFGDTGVAVHPDDERYKHLIGQTVTPPYTNRQIPIVAAHHVDKEFGSGAVKVTPAHDPNQCFVASVANCLVLKT